MRKSRRNILSNMELQTYPDDSVMFRRILGGGREDNLMCKSSRNIP